MGDGECSQFTEIREGAKMTSLDGGDGGEIGRFRVDEWLEDDAEGR